MKGSSKGHDANDPQEPVVIPESRTGDSPAAPDAPADTATGHPLTKPPMKQTEGTNGDIHKESPGRARSELGTSESPAVPEIPADDAVGRVLRKRSRATRGSTNGDHRKMPAPAATEAGTAEPPATSEPHGEVVPSEAAHTHVPPLTIFERWSPLLYIALTTGAEVMFIECYCHWHGAQFLLPNPLNLYSVENVRKLSHIGFPDNSSSVMNLTAEILMWSSLGVWSQRIAGMAERYRKHRPDLPYDLAVYIGLLGCHTSIAAAVIIILNLSGFQIFGVSLNDFDAVVGIAFVLGFFGEHTERLLTSIREQVFGKKDEVKLKHPPGRK
jgi:hypothetical protein